MNGYLDRLNLRPFEKRLVVGVAAMLFVVINIWFVLPHFSDWGRVKARMAKAQKTLDTFDKEIRQMRTYQAKILDLQKEGQDVPLEDQALQFLRTIQNQAVQSGVNIVGSPKLTTRTNDPFFLEQSGNLQVVSGEQQLVDFLFNLGSGASLIRVRDLSLRPDAPRQQLSANIRLVASYQKNATARPAVAAPPTVAKAPPRAGKANTSPTNTLTTAPGTVQVQSKTQKPMRKVVSPNSEEP